MTVNDSTSAASTASTAQAADASIRVPQKQLGQKDFLKLIAAQLAHQDPMKPMDDTTFIAQMANFSSLEQMSQMRTSSDLSFARSLMGQEVTVRDPEKQKNFTGIVHGVDVTDKGAMILINDEPYNISTVKSVRPPSVATTPTTTPATPTPTPDATKAVDQAALDAAKQLADEAAKKAA